MDFFMVLWECPNCRIQKNVICPVCGVDKEGGATCKACGSEYSHTTCPKCNYSEQIEKPLEINSYVEKIKEVVKRRENKYLTYYELIRLTEIIEPASLAEICKNNPIDVKNISQKALWNDKDNATIALCKIDGVSKRLAEKIIDILEGEGG
jgi:hypothetical protein